MRTAHPIPRSIPATTTWTRGRPLSLWSPYFPLLAAPVCCRPAGDGRPLLASCLAEGTQVGPWQTLH
jgi:hypothetical protein